MTVQVPAMGQGETVIWARNVTKGIIHKEVVGIERITNMRVIKNNNFLGLGLVEDIVITNRTSSSSSNYVGTTAGRGARTGVGTSRTKSKMIGDLVFIYQGKPTIIFHQIEDPSGVAALANAARKNVLKNANNNKPVESGAPSAGGQNPAVAQVQATEQIICRECRHVNAAGAKFCNGCGKDMAPKCAKCQATNPAGASFCSGCGLPLT